MHAAGVIVLTSGAGATAKTITVHTTKATMLKRYAPASVRFDDAQACADRCDSRGRPVARARHKECGRNGDCRRRGGLGQLPQHLQEPLCRWMRQARRWWSRIWRPRSRSRFTSPRMRRCGGCRRSHGADAGDAAERQHRRAAGASGNGTAGGSAAARRRPRRRRRPDGRAGMADRAAVFLIRSRCSAARRPFNSAI